MLEPFDPAFTVVLKPLSGGSPALAFLPARSRAAFSATFTYASNVSCSDLPGWIVRSSYPFTPGRVRCAFCTSSCTFSFCTRSTSLTARHVSRSATVSPTPIENVRCSSQ